MVERDRLARVARPLRTPGSAGAQSSQQSHDVHMLDMSVSLTTGGLLNIYRVKEAFQFCTSMQTKGRSPTDLWAMRTCMRVLGVHYLVMLTMQSLVLDSDYTANIADQSSREAD